MSEDRPETSPPSGAASKSDARSERLAAALRANLRRRKEQARARGGAAAKDPADGSRD